MQGKATQRNAHNPRPEQVPKLLTTHTNTMEPQRHPLDFSKLKRGDVISIPELERATCVDQSAGKDFRLAVLNLREQIMREVSIRNGCLVSVEYRERFGIKVLTHAEQSAYTANHFGISIRRAIRSNQFHSSVDVTQLSDREREEHERASRRQAFIISGMMEARRKLLADERTAKKPPELPPA